MLNILNTTHSLLVLVMIMEIIMINTSSTPVNTTYFFLRTVRAGVNAAVLVGGDVHGGGGDPNGVVIRVGVVTIPEREGEGGAGVLPRSSFGGEW